GSTSIGGLDPLEAVAHPTVLQDDLYLDTEDWRLAQAGYVLRVRTSKSKREVTLKALVRSSTGNGSVPKRRREVSEPFGENANHWIDAGGPVGWRVSALIGRRPLHQVLAIQTR